MALEKLGTQLDTIAFNYSKVNSIYEYSATNSKLISRQVINNLIKDVFDLGLVEIEGDNNDIIKKTAFNNLIASIQSEIQFYSEKDSIISWKRELGFVNTLITLNKNTVYNIDNVATEIGKNIDAIAFNYSSNKFNDIVYDSNNYCTGIPTTNGNSLFIKRDALKNTMNAFLSTVKYDTTTISDTIEKEQKEIVNDIIDNVTNVCSTNSELSANKKYKNMQLAFEDLSSIDNTIEDLVADV